MDYLNPCHFYKCLSDDTRLRIILLLQQKQTLCVCQLVDALALSQPKISRHLKLLREARILNDERREKWVYYHLNPDLPDWALQVIALTSANNQPYLQEQLQRIEQNMLTQGCD